MKDLNFVAFSHFIADMFQIISELSKTLQRNDLILQQAVTAVRGTVDQLENLLVRLKREGHLSGFLAAVQAQVNGQDELRDEDEDGENVMAKFQVNILERYVHVSFVIIFKNCVADL